MTDPTPDLRTAAREVIARFRDTPASLAGVHVAALAALDAATPREPDGSQGQVQCGARTVWAYCVLPQGHDGEHRDRGRPSGVPAMTQPVREDQGPNPCIECGKPGAAVIVVCGDHMHPSLLAAPEGLDLAGLLPDIINGWFDETGIGHWAHAEPQDYPLLAKRLTNAGVIDYIARNLTETPEEAEERVEASCRGRAHRGVAAARWDRRGSAVEGCGMSDPRKTKAYALGFEAGREYERTSGTSDLALLRAGFTNGYRAAAEDLMRAIDCTDVYGHRDEIIAWFKRLPPAEVGRDTREVK